MTAAELTDIAAECSQTERRAADAERELIEQKKIKFMEIACRRGLPRDHSLGHQVRFLRRARRPVHRRARPAHVAGRATSTAFRDTDRTICGARTGHCFKLGQRVEVILDRIDRQLRRLQFALLPGTEPTGDAGMLRAPSLRKRKTAEAEPRPPKTSKRSGKSKTRQRNKKLKGKR